MKRILFIVDKEGWAYDDAARNWRELLKKEYQCDILYLNKYEVLNFDHKLVLLIKHLQSMLTSSEELDLDYFLKEKYNIINNSKYFTNPLFDHRDYDGVYFFYHRALCDRRLLATPIPMGKIAIAINNEKWLDDGPEKEYETYMRGVRAIAGCNDFILNNFKNLNLNIFKISQSINPKIFYSIEEKQDKSKKVFKIGWSGNYSNPLKNFEKIKLACNIDGVKLYKVRELDRNNLNIWYNSMDAIICGSSSEGGPLMLLEAGAVGLPYLTTKVGLSREIIKDKVNGLFIDIDNKELILNRILELKKDISLQKYCGQNLKKEILLNWTYNARLFEIKALLKELTKE